MTGARVFAVAPGADFARELALGLRARLRAQPPEATARASLTLNTRRAGRAVALAFEALARDAGEAACFLPRIRTLDDLADDPGAGAPPPAVDPARRLLTLTRLTAAALAQAPALGPPAAAPALAEALGALLDETGRERASLDALDGVAPEAHAERWALTLDFLRIVREAWPAILEAQEGGATEAEARRAAAVAALAARWRAAPPGGVMVAAGSTGSRAVTAAFLAAVARAPQGAVVLPGFDPALAAEVWSDIGEEHPWGCIRRLLDGLGVAPQDVPWWTEETGAERAAAAPRRRLIAQALRPAPVTDAWIGALSGMRESVVAATAGLVIAEADDPRLEAGAVALALREALETPGATAALVTPDRELARRVAAALARWDIRPDDSGGRPMALTPPAMFLKLVAGLAFGPFDAVMLTALLKHPLAGGGAEGDRSARRAQLRAAQGFEIGVLRRAPGLAGLAQARAALDREARRRAERGAAPLPDQTPVIATLDALIALGETGPTLAAMAAAHLATAEALAGPALWARGAGAAVRAAAEGFSRAAEVYGPCAPGDYPRLFATCLGGAVREDAYVADARVSIWGPLEARMQRADLVVLGGLNEGVWPKAPPPDPWMNREMRAALGLAPAERLTGLAAHDVLTAACGPRVLLTRALRSGGAPTTRSRWLERLTTLLTGVDAGRLAEMRAEGDRLVRLAAMISGPTEAERAAARPAARPRPRPPVEHRPRRLSATQVEALIRDPFEIYARKVLRLEALHPVGRETDARDRGEALHAALERLADMPGESPEEIAAAFDAAADAALEDAAAGPAQRRLWRARLRRARETFCVEEAARRAAARDSRQEVVGAREAPGVDFTLTARADRIDILEDGDAAIYDYKTGSPPSQSQVEKFSPQLPLEAAILKAGGFEGLPAATSARLAYIGLGGLRGAARDAASDPAAMADEAWEKLLRLVERYRDPAQPYTAHARVKILREARDYDHLARFGEWEDGEAEAEGGDGG